MNSCKIWILCHCRWLWTARASKLSGKMPDIKAQHSVFRVDSSLRSRSKKFNPKPFLQKMRRYVTSENRLKAIRSCRRAGKHRYCEKVSNSTIENRRFYCGDNRKISTTLLTSSWPRSLCFQWFTLAYGFLHHYPECILRATRKVLDNQSSMFQASPTMVQAFVFMSICPRRIHRFHYRMGLKWASSERPMSPARL